MAQNYVYTPNGHKAFPQSAHNPTTCFRDPRPPLPASSKHSSAITRVQQAPEDPIGSCCLGESEPGTKAVYDQPASSWTGGQSWSEQVALVKLCVMVFMDCK